MTNVRSIDGRDTQGRFTPGNPGKPRGARRRISRQAEALFQDECAEVARAVLTAAKNGDMSAARLVLERVAPARKGAAVEIGLPPVHGAGDVPRALAALLAAVSEGRVSPEEAASVASLIEIQRRAIELADIETRLTVLEGGKPNLFAQDGDQ